MLVLSRKKNESIVIYDNIEVGVVDIRGDKVRLGVDAPKSAPVHRKEVFEAIKRKGESLLPPMILEQLPPDLSTAFEQMRLSIIRHQADGYQMVSQRGVFETLAALADVARCDIATV